MIHAIRSSSIRTCLPSLRSSPLPSYLGRKASGVRFVQAKAEQDKMDKGKNQAQKTGDVMSNSFGEGYASRSDEEGFGGIYGDNQSLPNPKEKANHPEYDKSQGSEVKEKEKARHQTNVAS